MPLYGELWSCVGLLGQEHRKNREKGFIVKIVKKQAGAEPCQAQHSLSLNLVTHKLTQPAVDEDESLAELQLRI